MQISHEAALLNGRIASSIKQLQNACLFLEITVRLQWKFEIIQDDEIRIKRDRSASIFINFIDF